MDSPVRASGVDPATIDQRIGISNQVELMVRRRPPSEIEVPSGHREHLLMCTSGTPVERSDVYSRLRSPEGVRQWRSCPAGEVSFIPAGYPIQWQWSYRSESVHLAVLPERLIQLTEGIDHPRDLRPVFRESDEGVAQLLHCLRLEASADALGSDLLTSSLLTALGVQLLRLAGRGHCGRDQPHAAGLSNAQKRRALELLNDRLSERFPLSELAAEFDLSPCHFARLFKQAIGIPPHEFHLRLRVKHACHSLRNQPHRTVADIACDLGFADENHLRRHFKRLIGTTPGAYRRQQ